MTEEDEFNRIERESAMRNVQPAPVREDWGPGPHEYHSLPAPVQQEPFGYLYEGTAEHTRHKTVFEKTRVERLETRWWREIGPCYTSPQPAQPQQEPVETVKQWRLTGDSHWENGDPQVDFHRHPIERRTLYTSPPTQRKPLTEDEVGNAFSAREVGLSVYGCFLAGIRHAEAAHGIKENT